MRPVNLSTMSDPELLLMFKAGDENAFKEIFNRYDRLLFIYACKKLQDKEEAKDVVQDVFINLWANRNNITINGSIHYYLYSAVRNKALNVFRDRHIDERCIASLQKVINQVAETADFRVRERDISMIIEKEIAALPPKMREVFELRRKEYLTNREIAKHLDISEQTVETHMKRALKVLRLRLGIIVYLALLLHF